MPNSGQRKRKSKFLVPMTPPPTKKVVTIVNDGKPSTKVVISPISTSNKYDPLQGRDDEVTLSPKKIKVPPIMVSSVSREKVIKFMESIEVKDYSIKPLKNGVHIYCQSIQSHEKSVKGLKNSDVGFYSHDLPGDKLFKIVLSGLHKMSIDEIKAELKLVKVEPIDIKIISPKSPRFMDHVNYILYFKKNTVKLQDLQKIKSVCFTMVRWKPYRRNKTGITQCAKCQRSGHGGRNCYMPPRCGYCAGSHESSNCESYKKAIEEETKKNSDKMDESQPSETSIHVEIKAKCANCQGSHFANDRNCPVKKKYEETRRKNSSRNNSYRRMKIPTAEDFQYEISGNRTQFKADDGLGYVRDAEHQLTYANMVSGTAPSSTSLTMNPNPFSMEEILSLTSDVLNGLQNVKSASRSEVIRIVMQISMKYLYNDLQPK